MKRTIWGFWQRFKNLDGSPRGKWIVFLHHAKSHAVRMHSMARRYSDTGPVFKTEADIPKRFHEGMP